MYQAQQALLKQQTQITSEHEKFNIALKHLMGETSENIQAMKAFIVSQGQFIEQQRTELLNLVSLLQLQAHNKRREDRMANGVGFVASMLVVLVAGVFIWPSNRTLTEVSGVLALAGVIMTLATGATRLIFTNWAHANISSSEPSTPTKVIKFNSSPSKSHPPPATTT